MKLFLKDGTTYEGESFGADSEIGGEVVFNTSMTGYVESLTDPSYAGQILVCTYPLIGNYGVPTDNQFESEKIQIAGLVVSEYSIEHSHQDAVQSLKEWLIKNNVPAITGVDTRAITKKLREHGVMLGAIAKKMPKEFIDPNSENLVAKVSIKEKRVYGKGGVKIIAVDCGMKENIVRSLLRQNGQADTTIIRVPWDYDYTGDDYDGLFISNGPGDPAVCHATIANLAKATKLNKPILGICLGVQLLALAIGGKTYKLKYGHRSQNQPCTDIIGRPFFAEATQGRCYITSQNHGFAVDAKSLPKDWQVWFTNANDESVEGIRHKNLPMRAVQFHPEAAPGPTDTNWIFDEFIETVKKSKSIKNEKK
jgi:carbamoyl-phosphate synthase small subunit